MRQATMITPLMANLMTTWTWASHSGWLARTVDVGRQERGREGERKRERREK